VITLAALALAALFGAGDQYLGSMSWYPWAGDISLLSAPWLVLAFLAGWTQRDPRRAALLGLGCTAGGLLGYGLMALSPIEHAQLSFRTVEGLVRSETLVLLGGVLTGPVFGWFGRQWRVERAWVGALVTAAAVCLEPVAHAAAGNAIRVRSVSLAEVAAGIAMALYVVAGTRRGASVDD